MDLLKIIVIFSSVLYNVFAMKGAVLILFLALVVIFILFLGRHSESDSAPENMVKTIEKAKITDVEAKIRNIIHAVNGYFSDRGTYPDSLDQLIPGYLRLESDLRDSWGTYFRLESDQGMTLYLLSAGPDGIFDNADDIKRRF